MENEKKSNEEEIEKAGYERSLLKTISKSQLQCFGHINRADPLDKQILSGKIRGIKSRGIQPTKYTDTLNNHVTVSGGNNPPTICSSGELTTERNGWP